MAKLKSSYFCQSCGAQSPKWIGKCPSCGQWNTYVEEIIQKEDKASKSWRPAAEGTGNFKRVNQPQAITAIQPRAEERFETEDGELNRVLGGGIVPGSLVLIGGEPGIGKSTLMLQIATSMKQLKVLYMSGEESEQQIKMRADRMQRNSPNCFILSEFLKDCLLLANHRPSFRKCPALR